MEKKKIRVAAVQFAVTTNVENNLATCLRMIDQAAQNKPQVIVLPEFVNHIAWYENAEHCYRVSVSLDDAFMRAIGAKAADHHCYIKINVTLRRENGTVSGTNVLFDPLGRVIGINDKQILMGNENNFLQRANAIAPILQTNLASFGMYACMDGVIPEVARALAVRNPQVLLNSLNSFALDEAALHIPVRAAENKVFVVAANKVGALVPEHMTEVVAARLKIAVSFLQGAGESQIVAPNGEVLAKAPLRGEAVIFADIDPTLADDKCRPDGTDILKSRRPMLYHPIGVDPKQNSDGGNAGKAGKIGAEKVVGAVIQPSQLGHGAIEEVCHAIVNAVKANAKMIVLPELFHLEGGRVADVYAAEAQSQHMCEALQHTLQAAPDDCYVACTLVEHNELGWQHVGVLLNRDGVALRQAQLHMAGRHAWVTALGARLEVVDTAWGRVALVVGNDAIYPETFRIAALQHTEVVAVPATILETWESTLGFAERAAENRMNVLVADRAESAIYAVTEDFTLWTEWKNRPFDGNINTPVVTSANHNVLTLSDIYPAATHNKMVSQRTDVLDGRPWALAEPIIS